jgi:tight adherence protein B
VSLLLLGASLVLLAPPLHAQRRLGWLATARWGHPAARDRRLGPAVADLARQALTGSRFGAGSAGLLLGLAAGLATGPVPGLLAGVAGWGLVRCAGLVLAERDDERCRAELAATVTALRDEYAAGATVAAAFTAAAASGGRFATAVSHAAVLAGQGNEVAVALRAEDELARLAVACDLAGRTGTPLGRLLTGVQAGLAADRQIHRAVRAALAGPRSSALLLAGLPVIGLALGTGMGARPVRMLLHTSAGLLALSAGVLLDVAGVAWTLILSRRALP